MSHYVKNCNQLVLNTHDLFCSDDSAKSGAWCFPFSGMYYVVRVTSSFCLLDYDYHYDFSCLAQLFGIKIK
jgi:hypothetical protein